MRTRRRVNMSVDPDLWERMHSARRRYGFANLCRLALSCVRTVMDAEERARHRRGRDDGSSDDAEYIASVFGEYSESERDKDGNRKAGEHRRKE